MLKQWQFLKECRLDQFLILIGLIALATLSGQVMFWLGMGKTGWFLGAIVSGLILSLALQQSAGQKSIKMLGQAFVGCSIGFALSRSDLTNFTANLPFLIFLTLVGVLSSNLIGCFYAKSSGIKLFNALLATVPGAISSMLSIAAEYPKAISQVAPVQVMRLTTVAVLLPFIADASSNYSPLGLEHLFSHFNGFAFLGVTIVAIAGIALGMRLKFPAPALLGAMVMGWIAGYLMQTIGVAVSIPPLFDWLGQILLGITIGQAWSAQAFGKRYLIQALPPVLLTLGLGFLTATGVMVYTGWDWLTCLLLTAPGGASEIASIALAVDPTHADLIAIGHAVRLLILIGGLPVWLFWFRFLDARLPSWKVRA